MLDHESTLKGGRRGGRGQGRIENVHEVDTFWGEDMDDYRTVLRLSAHDMASGEIGWLLWVKEDGEGDGTDGLFAGRVKLQDDPIVASYTVLQNALEKLESRLAWPCQPRLW